MFGKKELENQTKDDIQYYSRSLQKNDALKCISNWKMHKAYTGNIWKYWEILLKAHFNNYDVSDPGYDPQNLRGTDITNFLRFEIKF